MNCYGCNKPMPLDGAFYRYCFECGHVYVTARDLIEAHNKLNREVNEATGEATFNGETLPEIPMVESGDEIGYCPCCLHNF